MGCLICGFLCCRERLLRSLGNDRFAVWGTLAARAGERASRWGLSKTQTRGPAGATTLDPLLKILADSQQVMAQRAARAFPRPRRGSSPAPAGCVSQLAQRAFPLRFTLTGLLDPQGWIPQQRPIHNHTAIQARVLLVQLLPGLQDDLAQGLALVEHLVKDNAAQGFVFAVAAE